MAVPFALPPKPGPPPEHACEASLNRPSHAASVPFADASFPIGSCATSPLRVALGLSEIDCWWNVPAELVLALPLRVVY